MPVTSYQLPVAASASVSSSSMSSSTPDCPPLSVNIRSAPTSCCGIAEKGPKFPLPATRPSFQPFVLKTRLLAYCSRMFAFSWNVDYIIPTILAFSFLSSSSSCFLIHTSPSLYLFSSNHHSTSLSITQHPSTHPHPFHLPLDSPSPQPFASLHAIFLVATTPFAAAIRLDISAHSRRQGLAGPGGERQVSFFDIRWGIETLGDLWTMGYRDPRRPLGRWGIETLDALLDDGV